MQKNTNSPLFLNIGESFVEMATPQQGNINFNRWFSPKFPIDKILKEASPSESVIVSTQLAKTIIKKRLGTPPALLVTSGFENWLNMTIPASQNYFTLNVSKPKSPISNDFVFSVNERTQADGKIINEVNIQELEFLAAKLKLNTINTLAVNLLHSNVNPENENKIKNYFSEQGFKVFTASDCSSSTTKNQVNSERQRWWAAVLNAYTQPTWTEELTELENALQNSFQNEVSLKVCTNTGQILPWQEVLPLDTMFAHEWLNMKYFEGLTQTNKQSLACYFGVEKFQFFNLSNQDKSAWRSEFGRVNIEKPHFYNFYLQPTSIIEEGFWSSPFISNQKAGYEPGPMCFGRAVKPTFLDALYIDNKFTDIQGFSSELKEKTKRRISDTFFTYSKDSFSSDALENIGYQSLAAELSKFKNNIIYCAGPLASIMASGLKEFMGSKQIRNKEESFCSLQQLVLEGKK